MRDEEREMDCERDFGEPHDFGGRDPADLQWRFDNATSAPERVPAWQWEWDGASETCLVCGAADPRRALAAQLNAERGARLREQAEYVRGYRVRSGSSGGGARLGLDAQRDGWV